MWASGVKNLGTREKSQYLLDGDVTVLTGKLTIDISTKAVLLLLSTHSLDPYLWGESDHPASGPPASLSLHLASSFITRAGSVHKSRGDSVVRMWVQLKRWCVPCVWVLQREYSGDGCNLASTLCKYDFRKGDLFVLSWARV